MCIYENAKEDRKHSIPRHTTFDKREVFMILGNQFGNQKGLTMIDSLVLALILGAIIYGALFFDISKVVTVITG